MIYPRRATNNALARLLVVACAAAGAGQQTIAFKEGKMNKKKDKNENLRPYTMRLCVADMKELRKRAAQEGRRGYSSIVRALIHAYLTGEIDANMLPY